MRLFELFDNNKTETIHLSEAQLTPDDIIKVFSFVVNNLNEGLWDKVKAAANQAASSIATAKNNMSVKLKLDRLIAAWKKGPGYTASGNLRNSDSVVVQDFLIKQGYNKDLVDKAIASLSPAQQAAVQPASYQGTVQARLGTQPKPRINIGRAATSEDTILEKKKKPKPTDPDKWSRAKAKARSKFEVYPSAYANAWAAKEYKRMGGGWRMGE